MPQPPDHRPWVARNPLARRLGCQHILIGVALAAVALVWALR